MTEEQKVQKKILDHLNSLDNCKAIKIVLANEAGTPDIFCVWRGNAILIEVKASEEDALKSMKRQPIQQVRQQEWVTAGAYAITAWDWDQVDSLLGSIRL